MTKLISTAEAAKILGVQPQRVRQFFQDGRLAGEVIAGRIVYRASDVRALAKVPRRPGRPVKS